MPDHKDSRPVVAHCANPFLPLTTVWVYDQLRSLQCYRPVALTQTRLNDDLFPFDAVYDFSCRRGLVRLTERIRRKFTGFYAGYGRVMRDAGAVVAHAHFGQEGFRCLKGVAEADIPLVTTFYGFDATSLPKAAAWAKRFKRLFDRGDHFLAEGPAMAELIAGLGCHPDKITVQRLGVDLDTLSFAPLEDREEKTIVLMYAAMREKKGHIHGVRAFSRCLAAVPDARLHVIGDGPLRGMIEQEVSSLDIGERVTWHGWLPHSRCLEMLGRARVLLYPSVTATDGDSEGGAPVALIEALAKGTPIVSSRHADIPFVAPEGGCSLLADERDETGLADALVRVLTDDALASALVHEGRAQVEAYHDLTLQGASLEAVYDRLTA